MPRAFLNVWYRCHACPWAWSSLPYSIPEDKPVDSSVKPFGVCVRLLGSLGSGAAFRGRWTDF
jgi:hypothetical protein